MAVFDDIPRARLDVPHQDERHFPYLNASARDVAAVVRALVEEWMERYPASHRDALITRFRSNIDDEHYSAFFELFLHELMLKNGHKIVAIEPDLEHTPRRPDFLVESQDGTRFYLEAVLATGRSQEEVGAINRLNQALRAVDTMPCDTHYLGVNTEGHPSRPVTIKTLRASLRRWVDELPREMPNFTPFIYEEWDMRIEVKAFPKSTPRPARSIGSRGFPAQFVTMDEDLRAAVEKKASRYGALPAPFIVAVNGFGMYGSDDDIMDAMMGDEVTESYVDENGKRVTREVRQPNGVWHGPKGPRRKGLSAVLSMREVSPWNFASRKGRFVRNPWASNPMPSLPLGVPETNPVDGVWKQTEGQSFGDIFGLREGWPG